MSEIKHDLNHEVYLDPKDGKEHINHGKMEYTKADLGIDDVVTEEVLGE